MVKEFRDIIRWTGSSPSPRPSPLRRGRTFASFLLNWRFSDPSMRYDSFETEIRGSLSPKDTTVGFCTSNNSRISDTCFVECYATQGLSHNPEDGRRPHPGKASRKRTFAGGIGPKARRSDPRSKGLGKRFADPDGRSVVKTCKPFAPSRTPIPQRPNSRVAVGILRGRIACTSAKSGSRL